MLAVTSYPKDYVDACRRTIAAQLDAYDALANSGGAAVAAFEPGYFNLMVLALDHFFLHRLRSGEGKDGNPLNELRMLCDGIKDNGGVLKKNGTIKYDAARSVAGIGVDQAIVLDRARFGRLAGAVFDEVGKRFGG